MADLSRRGSGRGPPQRSTRVDPGVMLERLQSVLQEEVSSAVRPIAHLESSWSEAELVKRLVRYFLKAAQAPDLLGMPWDQACKSYVNNAMSCLSASCQERQWFFDVDLSGILGRAAWELLSAGKEGTRHLDYGKVTDVATAELEDNLDRILLQRGIWIATEATFQDQKIVSKVSGALNKAYLPAFEEVLADTRPLDDLEKIENFTKKWMHDSLARAWHSVGDVPGAVFSEANVVHLFANLMAPFGETHPFSCVPTSLTARINRPPKDWLYLRDTSRNLLRSWNAQEALGGAGAGSKKKKRRTAAQEADDGMEVAAPPRPVQRRPVAPPTPRVKEESVKEEIFIVEDDEVGFDDEDELGMLARRGHPACTSDEDCVGRPSDGVIRHLLNGTPGDLYCQTCWRSFLVDNPSLQGRPEPNGIFPM